MPGPRTCPRCAVAASESWSFCPECGAPSALPGYVEEQVLPLIKEGRWLEGIKAYRAATRAGLAASKRKVEELALAAGIPLPKASPVALLFLSLFLGLMVVSAGIAVLPALAKVAAPVVCGGRFEIESRRASRPGRFQISRSFYCAESSGQRKEITAKTLAAAYVLHTLIIFALLLGAGKIWTF